MSDTHGSKPITAVVVGAGHRGLAYASYALMCPDLLKIVGVADPNDIHRRQLASAHSIPADCCFRSVEELTARPAFADAAINATMDKLHVSTSLPLLKGGYHLLLEKPISTNQEDVLTLLEAAKRHGRTVMICHVLRYAPFYAEIRKRVADGQIGRIMSIETNEHVCYHHMDMSYIRGKWSRQEVSGSSMLMAKCCHDLDLVCWFKAGVAPRRVGSFGSLMFFRPENAPLGAGKRCLVDCKIEESCPHSARKIYVTRKRWKVHAFASLEHLGPDLTDEQKLQSLRGDNPFGRCVWHCDNNVVDHQTVLVEFADGCTAMHNMVGGTARGTRTIRLLGAKGQIDGDMKDGVFYVRIPDPSQQNFCTEEKVEVNVKGSMHGGGDMRLVADFVSRLGGEAPSISCTNLEDSLFGHWVGFAADRAMEQGRVMDIQLPLA